MSQGTPPITTELYNAILAAWLETPSVRSVAYTLDLPRSFITKVRDEGMPELGLPPLTAPGTKVSNKGAVSKLVRPENGNGNPAPAISDDMTLQSEIVVARKQVSDYVGQMKVWLAELEQRADRQGTKADVAEAKAEIDGTMAEFEAAEARIKVQEHRITTTTEASIRADVVKRSADEAVAAGQMLNNCVNVSAIMSHITEKILEGIEAGAVTIPAVVDPKILASLAISAEKLTGAMDRSIKIQRGRGGEADDVVGVKLGLMIEDCTPEELENIQETGRLPSRFRELTSGN